MGVNKMNTPESNEKGNTKELNIDELKKALAKEEAENMRKRRLQKLEERQENKVNEEKEQERKPASKKIQSTPRTPEELRRARRLYWQEKQEQEQAEKTPYHRYPQFFYAGFWIRFFAYLTDLIVINSLTRLILTPFFLLMHLPITTELFSAFSLGKLALYLMYFILLTKFTNGQTIGKMIFGLRVVCFKEEKLSWLTVLIREGFGRYILKTISILYLVILFTERNQQIADILSDTTVISEKVLAASKWNQLSTAFTE